jgi:uncharacterized protein (TIGR02453 family)
MSFAGFPRATFKFLEGLARDNSKACFDAHRDDYESFYVEPAKHFVAAIGPKLRVISKTVNFVAKVNGSIFRIQRDTRFSKDKAPYKTHLDFWFWEGEHRGWDAPGYFLRLTPKEMIIGAGMHRFEAKPLAAYRNAVLAEGSGKRLEKIAAALDGLTLGGATRKSVPRGFDAAHPRSRFLMHDGLFALHEGPLPRSVFSQAFVNECLGHFRRAAPIAKWLMEFVVT